MNKKLKLLALACAVLFLAAACDQTTPQANQTPATPPAQQQSASATKVDSTVNALNKSLDTESAINMQSDSDITDDDQEIINSYNGVSNASSY